MPLPPATLVPQPLIIAHRGASRHAPENSLSAFKMAWELGADGIEGDFRLTKDGYVVCIHDADTERTLGVKHIVAESTLDQLRQAITPTAGSGRHSGDSIATLAEVLACVPLGKRIFVELKTGPEVVQPLKETLEASLVEPEQIVLIAFDVRTIWAAKQALPGIRAHWLTSYSSADDGDRLTHPTSEEILQTLRATGADGLGTQARMDVFTPEFAQALHLGGLTEFHVWTVSTPEAARYFQSLSPFAITTDFPAELRTWLEAR